MEPLTKRNAKEMLRCLSKFLQYRGFGGLLIALDEVENVLLSTPKARREAYITLRELIDNVDYRHGVTTTCFIAAGTPDLFEGGKGFSEYEALATRVLLPSTVGPPNPRSSVVDLSRFPLTRDDFQEMSEKILAIFEIAKNIVVPTSTGDRLEDLLDAELKRNPDTTARSWVRTVVEFLSNS
jgi:hypothetical protein